MIDTTQLNLEDYTDQRVRVTKKEGDPVEGRVEAANHDSGLLLIKVKGKTSAVMVFAFEIADIELVTSSEDDVTQTTLKPVRINNVRRHLVNAHGWHLPDVNKLTDDQAFKKHLEIHADEALAPKLGHRHEA